ncbi:hypothetical protein Pstr01_16650 [Pseudomonas straminea]|nr:hypothetical protein Pstr01_16650 [Pseudomonas straminea]
MTDQHQLATDIAQLIARHLSGQCTLPRFDGAILGAYRHRKTTDPLDNLAEMNTDRKHRNLDIGRQ